MGWGGFVAAMLSPGLDSHKSAHPVRSGQGGGETWAALVIRDYSFLGNLGLISSDGHGKANTTAGEEADTI